MTEARATARQKSTPILIELRTVSYMSCIDDGEYQKTAL